MMKYTIMCPACGKTFDDDQNRESIFCVFCGKKLRLTWKVECSLADEEGPVTTGSANLGTTDSSASSENIPSGPAHVAIRLPDFIIGMKGSFAYFGIKWDDRDVANGRHSDTISIDTTCGNHALEIRQVNNAILGSNIKRTSFGVTVTGNMMIEIATSNDEFYLK